MSKPAIPENIIGQAPKARIVQYQKKRYSIRLEPVFWHALERMAKGRGVKLGRFLVELEEHHQGVNFASFLRSYCMIEAEEKLASHGVKTTRATIEDILISSPSAGCLINVNMRLVNANDAFYSWIREDKRRIEGNSISNLLQIRANKDLYSAWNELINGETNLLRASVIRVVTGRVMTAKARFVNLRDQQKNRPLVLMWLAIAPRAAGVASRPIASRPPTALKPEESSRKNPPESHKG